VRRDYCEKVVLANPAHNHRVWCEDFLSTGGYDGKGACCRQDEKFLLGYCKNTPRPPPLSFGSSGGAAAEGGTTAAPPLDDASIWDAACDPSSPLFGTLPLRIDTSVVPNKLISLKGTNQTVSPDDGDLPLCDVLGLDQRQWLRGVVETSDAPLLLVASG
jgi:hypothetical protein